MNRTFYNGSFFNSIGSFKSIPIQQVTCYESYFYIKSSPPTYQAILLTQETLVKLADRHTICFLVEIRSLNL